METFQTEVKVVPMTQKMITLSLIEHLLAATTCEHQWLSDHIAIHMCSKWYLLEKLWI